MPMLTFIISLANICCCMYSVTIEYYRKTSNKRLVDNKSRPLIGVGCTGTLNLKIASNYIHLINACLQ